MAMAPPLQLLQSPLLLHPHPHPHLHLSHRLSLLSYPPFKISTTSSIPTPKPHKLQTPKPPRASVNADQTTPTKPTRRKKTPSTSSTTPKSKPKPKTRKPKTQKGTTEPNEPLETQEEKVITKDPELICCLGGARKEFVPTVRVAEVQMHPDMYSQWKMLQWKPPEFARAPSGPASNVAIAHVRLGGRTEFMGKVGRDGLGEELVELIEKERVGTRGMKVDESGRTGRSYMRVKFDEDEGKLKVETVRESAEDSFASSELNFDVLKEPSVPFPVWSKACHSRWDLGIDKKLLSCGGTSRIKPGQLYQEETHQPLGPVILSCRVDCDVSFFTVLQRRIW